MADNLDEYGIFLSQHKPQLLNCGVPEIYWEALHKKLCDEIFDADKYFTLVYNEDKELHPVVSCEHGIKKDDSNRDGYTFDDPYHFIYSIFLVDHAWTYEAEFSRAQLRKVPGLAKRMALLMALLESEENNGHPGTNEEMCSKKEGKQNVNETRKKLSSSEGFFTDENGQEYPEEELVELIFDNMWRFNQTYQVKIMDQTNDEEGQHISSLQEQVSFWYIVDEFASRIPHSDNPSWEMKCFFYAHRGISYSILFPTRDHSYGDIVTRDFIHGIADPTKRAAALYPWKPECFVLNAEININCSIDSILFTNENRCNEMYTKQTSGVVYLTGKESYNVFTDVANVAKSIKEPKFRLVETPEEADILWIVDHYKDFKSLQESGKQYINQFPFENVLTCKDLLARVVDRVGTLHPESRGYSDSNTPSWFQESFNLNLELPQFVQNFLDREERNEDNIWIIKPWNLGRSLDTHVTSNLNHIIRLTETGPKIAFKYIQNPVLLDRQDVGKVKFHFRYMAAVTCVDPLIINVDKVFWIGCANKPFSLDQFDVYEKHFTTMNYRSNVTFAQICHDEFSCTFDEQHPDYKWSDVEVKVHRIIKELFEAATSERPPRGIGHCKMSRAYYALDFMLKWADDGSKEMQPVLLEVNFNPDCNRLFKFYPDSFHHLFTSLFLGEQTPWESVRL